MTAEIESLPPDPSAHPRPPAASPSTGRPSPDQIRASDAERERLAAELGRHHADGRLDSSELAARLDAAYTARTRAELDALATDLPKGSPAPPRTTQFGPRCRCWPPSTALGLAVSVLVVAGVLADLIATAALGHHYPPWHEGHALWGAWWLVLLAWWGVRHWRRRHGFAPTHRTWNRETPWPGRR
ncbi:MAG: DUF1707 SHOCT-like domain-containing protein [Acidimicrobiales bacterium]